MNTEIKKELLILCKLERSILEEGKIKPDNTGIFPSYEDEERLRDLSKLQDKYTYGWYIAEQSLEKQLESINEFKKYIIHNANNTNKAEDRKMGNIFKKALEEAGRYEEVLDIIKEIIITKYTTTCPVKPFIINGNFHNRINSECLINEATILLTFIEHNVLPNNKPLDLINLSNFVMNKTDVLLHNYAVSISHRNQPTIDMDVIRCWEILDNMISCINDDDEWVIPKGWKKLEGLERLEK